MIFNDRIKYSGKRKTVDELLDYFFLVYLPLLLIVSKQLKVNNSLILRTTTGFE